MRYCKPLRAFFVLIQVSLTIYFIWYSFDNWEKTPIVTSTEFKTLHNEEFPAVSICFDNTNWKWPALINLASRWVTNKTDLNIASLPWKIPVSEQINFIRNGKSAFMANEYFSNQDFTMDMCKALSVLFPKSHDKELKDFFLAVSNQMENNLNQAEAVQLWENVAQTTNFGSFKNATCSLEFMDCNNLTTDCLPPMKKHYSVNFAILSEFCKQWAYRKYLKAKTLLHIQQHQAFKINNFNSLKTKQYLLLLMHHISYLNHTDVFSVWHYLHGFFIKNQGVGKYLVQSGDRLGIFTNICTNREKCQDVGNLIEGFDEETFERLIDLLDQPKIHSKNDDDFSLVPLCSFGNDTLKKCHLFQKSKLIYQDNTCFTYDADGSAEPFAPNGLNLLLNLKHMPSEHDLSVKLFVHEHGTIPDVLRLESTYEEIQIKEKVQVGLTIRTTQVTESFAKMSFEKRKCLLPEEKAKYSRIKCLTDQIQNFAQKNCQCLPILLGGLTTNVSHQNVECSDCFRKAVVEAKSLLNESLCPHHCTSNEFIPMINEQFWDDPTENGEDLVSLLNDNPLGIFLDKLVDPNMHDDPVGKDYFKLISQGFSLIQIFFKYPQKTVFIKDAKVTETDMVSNIGGTIGIFLGLSTISVLDKIIDWLVIFYATKVDKIKNKRQARKL